MARQIGQQERALHRDIKEGRMAAAYLVTAAGEEDAHLAAREIVQRIFCEKKTACGACLACRKFQDGNLIDYLEIDAKGGIKMEEVRRIPEFLSNRAQEGGARCIFLKNADDLTVQEQNYLLKSLEEPAEGVVFVLSAAQSERLLPTVRSRCIEVRIRPLPKKELVRQLRQNMGEQQAAFAAAWAGGSYAQAQKIAGDQELAEGRPSAAKVCMRLATKKNPSVFEMEKEIMRQEARMEELFYAMATLMRDAIYYQTGNLQLMNPDDLGTVQTLAERFTKAQLYGIMNLALERCERKRRYPQVRSKLIIMGLLFDILEVKAKSV
ncbi:MAG: hypothetical protein KH334_02710 [Clostridiales bacterium]|nr:hypothetical protein [Clostridiales bacterium]